MRNIFWSMTLVVACLFGAATAQAQKQVTANKDRKSTRLNSSH